VGIPDAKVGERIKAFVVLKKDVKGITGYDLIKWCRGRLVEYKIPKYIEFRDMLPKSKVGKLLRREIRTEERPAGKRKTAAPVPLRVSADLRLVIGGYAINSRTSETQPERLRLTGGTIGRYAPNWEKRGSSINMMTVLPLSGLQGNYTGLLRVGGIKQRWLGEPHNLRNGKTAA